MNIKIPLQVQNILNLIKNTGYEAYIVGGFVRDSLLKKETYDVDITTSMLPNELKNILKEYTLNTKYIKYGCLKFKVDKFNIEITTYRKEGIYHNHRNPSYIEFTNKLDEDLKRRDLTINALCYDGNKLIDMYDGLKDLKNKKIKMIGEPNLRLKEDSLRVLRVLRFASNLKFDIDYDLKKALFNNYKYLKEISFFKNHIELEGILKGENYLYILKEYKLIFEDVFKINKLELVLFKENIEYSIKEALFFYNSEYKIKNRYLLLKEEKFICDKKDLKFKLNKYGYQVVHDFLLFRNKYMHKDKKIYFLLEKIISNKECYCLKDLKIKSSDLLQFNLEKEKISKYLNLLLEAVINEECLNEKEALLNYFKRGVNNGVFIS